MSDAGSGGDKKVVPTQRQKSGAYLGLTRGIRPYAPRQPSLHDQLPLCDTLPLHYEHVSRQGVTKR